MSKTKDLQNQVFRKILSAKIYSLTYRSPIHYAHKLSEKYQNKIHMKREDLQSIFSFKIRGAYHRLQEIVKQTKIKKVVCVSAGNHGQGVALAAKSLKLEATVVMPVTTPQIKIDAGLQFEIEINWTQM